MLNNVTREFVYQNPSLNPISIQQSLLTRSLLRSTTLSTAGGKEGICFSSFKTPLCAAERGRGESTIRVIYDCRSYFFSFSLTVALGGAVNPAILPSCMVSSAELGTITIVEFCFKPS